jgi:regulator of protease activity HflC (stomatin/prohibitin superfamily)
MSSIIDADALPTDAPLSEGKIDDAREFRRVRSFIRTQAKWLVLLTGVLLFLLVFYWDSIFVTIESGQVGVMYRRFAGGTVTDRLQAEGIRFVPPWDRLYVYNVRLQEISHAMTALTQEGLVVNVSLSIRYRPEKELVGLLHQSVGPDYARTVVVPEVEGALRRIIGVHKVDAIYMNANTLDQRVLEESVENAQRNYVHIDAVIFRSIELPKPLQERIEAKLMEKEAALTYQFRIQIAEAEAERRRIEAGGVAAYNNIVNPSLTPDVLQWEALQATKELAKSPNAKTVVIGRNADGLPIILPK